MQLIDVVFYNRKYGWIPSPFFHLSREDDGIALNNIPGLQGCLENAFSAIAFPKFKNLRQMATYNISIRGGAVAVGSGAAKVGDRKTDPDAFEEAQSPEKAKTGDPAKSDPDAF